MKDPLFVDASAWVAVESDRERMHRAARAFLEGLLEPSARFGNMHTSLHAVLEAHGFLLHHTDRRRADNLLTRATGGARIHGSDAAMLGEALAKLQRRGAEEIELADAVNAATMDRLGVRAIWSYDRDYEILGYERLGE